MTNTLGYEVDLNQPYEQAIETVIAALKTEGFGVLTRIDMRATMKEKLDADFRPYMILGACNPPLAYRTLTLAPQLGLMLPCNVTVEASDAQRSLVRIADPGAMLMTAGELNNVELNAVAQQATQKMERVVALLQAQV